MYLFRYYLILTATVIFINVATTQTQEERAIQKTSVQIQAILDSISGSNIHTYLDTLVSFYSRHTNTDTVSTTTGIGAARRWVFKKFQQFGKANGNRLQPQYFNFNATICGVNQTYRNVMAILPGTVTPNRYFVVSGHLDNRGDPTDACAYADIFSPGANDDGSGTALTLELARVLCKYQFEASIIFMTVVGEDEGLYGSTAYANYARTNNMQIEGMITNDIVGNIVGDNGIVDSLSVRHFSSASDATIHRQLARYMKLKSEFYYPTMFVNLIAAQDRPSRSGDHVPFQNKSYPAVRFTEPNENLNNQHTATDIVANMSPEYTARVGRVNATGIASWASAPATPAQPQVTDLGTGTQLFINWTQTNTEPDFAGYRVAVRDQGRLNYTQIYDVDTAHQFVINGLTPGINQYVCISAYDSDGNESIFSTETLKKPTAITISGTVFNDLNNNAAFDGGETGVSNWKIKFTGTKADSTYTDANGNYSVILPEGSYTIVEVVQQGWVQTFPTPTQSYSVTLTNGQTSINKNFGNFQLGAILGNVFEDVNEDGVHDIGEMGILNRKIKLSGSKIDSILSDSSGNYSFTNLPIGNYTVTEQSLTGWAQTLPTTTYDILVASSGNIFSEKDFGNYKYAIISGNVFNDINGDTVKNTGEIGVFGKVYVRSISNQTLVDSIQTDEDGNYVFTRLHSGTVELFGKASNGISEKGTSLNTVQTTIVSGLSSALNFAIFFNGAVAGKKFHDLNGDGILSGNETGIANAKIYLNGIRVDSTTTDGDGNYTFADLYAGNYTLTTSVSLEGGEESNTPLSVAISSGSKFLSTNLGEYKSFSITIQTLKDNDGDTLTSNDRAQKSWAISLFHGLNVDSLISSINADTLAIHGLRPGNYSVIEADTATWKNIVVFVANHTVSQTAVLQPIGVTGIKLPTVSNGDYLITFVNSIRDTSKFRTFVVSTDFAEKSKKLTVKSHIPKIANVRDTVMKHLGAMTLGLPQTEKDSIKKYGWISLAKGTDIANFYTSAHTLAPKPFDSIRFTGKKAKLFVKVLKATRKNYDNKLAEQFAMFKFNIAASHFKVTPIGFGDLEFRRDGNMFDKMVINDIAAKIDTILTKWKSNDSGFNYLSLHNVIKEINESFVTSFSDTVMLSYNPLQFSGGKDLDKVAFLRKPSGATSFSSTTPGWLTQSAPEEEIPQKNSLLQNYPNPFNPSTAIGFSLSAASTVSLKVFDVLGREVVTLINGEMVEEGVHEITFDANALSSGIYFYRLTVNEGEFIQTEKLILMK